MFFNFENAVLTPENWVNKAEELNYAADILADFEKNRRRIKRIENKDVVVDDNIYLLSQVIMLYGFAIENLLKALKCKRNGIEVNYKGEVNGLNHDILNLAKELGITLSQKETKYMEKIIRHILWEGRYPSSKSRSGYTEEWTENNVDKWHNTYVRDYDINMTKNIYNNIYIQVEEELFKKG